MSLSYRSSELIAATNPCISLTYPTNIILIPFLQNGKVKSLLKNLQSRSPLRDQRFYVHFEKLQGKGNFPIVDVHLSLDNSNESGEENYIGSLGLYGVEERSTPSLEHDGSGMQVILDATTTFQKLREGSNWINGAIELKLTPSRKLKEGEELTVGRVEVVFCKVE